MMKETDLEEEALTVTAEGQTMTIERRTLGDTVGELEITGPEGETATLTLDETAPGRFGAVWEGPDIGLYRLKEGDQEAVIALGPASPREFEETIASAALLEEPVDATRGGVVRVSNGVPDIRRVREGRVAAGRGWIGITPRDAYLTADIRVSPLLPACALLLLASLMAVGAWLWEGRR